MELVARLEHDTAAGTCALRAAAGLGSPTTGPRSKSSPATSSMTPFCSRMELAWIMPPVFTTCACKAMVPASAIQLAGIVHRALRERHRRAQPPSVGRLDTITCWPAYKPMWPPGAEMLRDSQPRGR